MIALLRPFRAAAHSRADTAGSLSISGLPRAERYLVIVAAPGWSPVAAVRDGILRMNSNGVRSISSSPVLSDRLRGNEPYETCPYHARVKLEYPDCDNQRFDFKTVDNVLPRGPTRDGVTV